MEILDFREYNQILCECTVTREEVGVFPTTRRSANSLGLKIHSTLCFAELAQDIRYFTFTYLC